MDCRHTECARAFMAWFQIMTWKKPGMLRAVPSMLRAVPDDALVDDAVTAAGLRTWKKLWMLRTAPDDGLIQSAVMAADVVHRAATRYEQATLAYLASYTGRHSMIQFEQLARAELHWMAVCFLQYVRRHHAWIEEVFKIMNLDLGQTFDAPDDERTSFRHSMSPVRIEVKILFRYGELIRVLAGRWRPLRTGAGHGRPGRPPGRCGCAVTSLLQRDGGGTVRFRQEIWLPAQPVVVARRRERGCGGGGAGGGVGAPRAALGGRTHRLCLDSARIRGGGGCCDGAGERGERRGGRRRGCPPVVDGRRRGAG